MTAERSLQIEVEANSELSLAMVENSVPLVARISLTNIGDTVLQDLVVEAALLPDFSGKWSAHVSAIPPGGTFHVDDIELPLDRDKLVNQLERGGGEFVLWVRHPAVDAPLATRSRRIDVLAYNEWSRGTLPQLLAAFVLPNHPAVADLLAEARQPLERLSGNPALNGYQAGDPARVAAIVQAVYEALQARGITYSNPPASFESSGQKIRTPEQVIGDRVATCLDVSALLAAALEQAGLHPLIVIIEGHAFPAVWLEPQFTPEGYVDDGSLLHKLVALGRVLAFDSSAAVSRPAVPFAEAKRVASRYLEQTPFRYAVDIVGARRQHFRPLPVRVAGGYAAAVEVPVSVPQSGPSGVPQVTRSDASGRSRPSARTKHARVEAWKQRLLDTTLRNRLLNFKDTKQTIDLLCDELGPIEDALALGEELRLRSRPPLLGGDDPRSRKLVESRVANDAVKPFLRERLEHGELYTDHASETTSAKLTTIYRAAREALEETGANNLCLTFGMLEWYESESSEQVRRSPILLLPVAIERNARTDTFTIRSTGEDARLNVTLFEKLRLITDITLPELTELPLDQAGVDVAAVMNAVRNAVLNIRRFDVKDELHLGLFSFAKFQMWADLDQNIEVLLENPVIQHLLNGKGDPYPNHGPFPEPHELDDRISSKDLLCPMDADASQLAAVASAADGKTFVLQGPPGTGKSQTITNLITHCIAKGKRVLFVAEKAAALEVVQRRLAQVGLGPHVLELHSHKAGKMQVLEQFREALEAQPTASPSTWDAGTRKLDEERRYLTAYSTALHKKGSGGFSLFQALGQLDALRQLPYFELPAACADGAQRFEALQKDVEDLRDALDALTPITESPWQGCSLPAWQVDLPSRVSAAIEEAFACAQAARHAANALASRLGATEPATLGDVDALCAVATTLREAPPHGEALPQAEDWARNEADARSIVGLVRTRDEAVARLKTTYQDALFALDLDSLGVQFRKFARAFALFAWWSLRGARKTLRAVARDGRLPTRAQIADDLDLARTTRDLQLQLAGERDSERARRLFGTAWRGSETKVSELEDALSWATRFRSTVSSVRRGLLGPAVPSAPDLPTIATTAGSHLRSLRDSTRKLYDLLGLHPSAPGDAETRWEHIESRLTSWRNDLHRLHAWRAHLTASQALAKAGCGRLVEAALSGTAPTQQLPALFKRGVYQSWVRQALAQEPTLATFDGERHHRSVAAFADLDLNHLTSCGVAARAEVSRRLPQAGMTATGGEMGVLQKELQKKRKHMPIRKLLHAIPSLAARLKPCFLMSPMSVATYLDPRATPFDIIVFDEASQIPSHDAIGVLARGRSAVVVGDAKQLPPTSFFQSGSDDDAPDDNEFEELESILNECIAAGFPERRLDWHYRSRHESLIAFSNFHYYRNRLNTFPSAAELGPGRGVRFREVNGFYDKGGSRTNKAEADAVVADLLARLAAPDAKMRTYGVVTFSQAQQKLVEDLLDRARSANPELEPFFDKNTNTEPVIVKNLENIQGDERDVMIFSICYGPDQTGKPTMNFGPLNRDGGERRLNVAVTRAREELVVYSTLKPEQIDLSRTNSVAIKHLKTFLDYARRGPRAIAEALTVQSADQFDSPFEEQVCEMLRGLGYTVHTQVGCAGYRIDMGVRHPEVPGRYVLAIECDGAHYHSARSARERDRLRAQVLRGLGWKIHRIWSTDWWQAPDRELQKVCAAIERARTEIDQEPAPSPASELPLALSVALTPPSAPTTVSQERAHRSRPTASPTRTRDESVPQLIARETPSSGSVVPYRIAEVPEGRRSPDDVHDDRYREELKSLLHEVIAIEAPLSLRVLGRRISGYFGIQRTTNRLEERLRSVLGRTVRIHDEVVWRLDQDPNAYKETRMAPPEARREAQEVPLEEVANAALSVLNGSIALEHDELVKLTARVLGFARTGERVAEHIAAGLGLLVRRGAARRDGERVVLS